MSLEQHSARQQYIFRRVPHAQPPSFDMGAEDDTSVVAVDYSELLDDSLDLDPRLERAFGPKGLGILTVSGVQQLIEKRQTLLPHAQRLAVGP